MAMCIEILKNPAAAFANAKKKGMKETWMTLIAASVLVALTTGIAVFRGGGFTDIAAQVGTVTTVSVFIVVIIMSVVLGYILKIIVNILGGRGEYYEGLTVISYSMLPISVAFIAAAVLSFIPAVGILLSMIVLAVGFAAGLSMIYRGIKELFKTDMVTALVAVSVLILVMFISMSASFGLSALMQLGTIVPLGV